MYDPSSWRKHDVLFHWHNAAFSLIKQEPKTKSILELGAGMGSFSELLRNEGFKKIICVDGSKKYVLIIGKKGFKTHQLDLNEKLKFKKSSFDIIISLEVIEHLEKAELFLQEINRILIPGGILILSTQNFAWLPYRFRYLLGRPPHHEGYHIRHFTYFPLINLLKKSGFTMESSWSFMPFPYLNRFLKKLGKRPVLIKINLYQNLFAQDLVFKVKKVSIPYATI